MYSYEYFLTAILFFLRFFHSKLASRISDSRFPLPRTIHYSSSRFSCINIIYLYIQIICVCTMHIMHTPLNAYVINLTQNDRRPYYLHRSHQYDIVFILIITIIILNINYWAVIVQKRQRPSYYHKIMGKKESIR